MKIVLSDSDMQGLICDTGRRAGMYRYYGWFYLTEEEHQRLDLADDLEVQNVGKSSGSDSSGS